MSGGVDSSVSALLLKEMGYDVVGISMQLWDYSQEEDNAGSCCSIDDLHDARRVAEAIDIPFYVLNLEQTFLKEVVDYFTASYLEGNTPNPCLKCNQTLKFEVLLKKIKGMGIDYLATGHYARVSYNNERDRYVLLKGRDKWKDQSYFLFTLTQEQMSSLIFPVGDYTKEQVRDMARKMGIKVADKRDSQDICFIPDGDYHNFISERMGEDSPGEIVDRNGRVVGMHSGLFRYTVGQRRGIGISAREPLYVLEVDRLNNRLVVGEEEGLTSCGLMACDLNWIGLTALNSPIKVESRIRYRHTGVNSLVTPLNGNEEVDVRFVDAQRAVTPGQAVVFYDGDEVLGGGWIREPILA